MSPCGTETDLLPCGIAKIGKDRNLLNCNRYALDLLACGSVDDIAGRKISELVSVGTQIFLDSYVYPMLLNEGRAEEVQLILKSLAGETKPIVANIRMNADQTTDWAFMTCVNRDQLYTELLGARDTLQAQTRELGRLNARSQERQSNLQAFCQSLSHDFSGPIRRIRQLIELALMDLRKGGIEAPEEFEMLGYALKNSEVLTDLTTGLVGYLVADLAVSHDETVDLEEIISTVLSMREQQDPTKPKVQRTSLPTITGSKAQLLVLFKNLLENAIKYNENDPEITISHSENVAKSRIVIAIKDNGIGMSAESLEKVFDPFTRLNLEGDYKGSGLGLSIVKKMVMNHDGDIWAESTPGTGSTFYVSLPLNPRGHPTRPDSDR
ncbi:sensor histidine kinase [Denitrobaculum tricleocarpae]|uniref:histidine kinase n=1 Tax=Denitrobaculum tricleocarpae TaxID=2591009 RepID=A0A545SXN5_9PROT|nr:ATP-binding protein [Denitrobaculum tricleocarpae]TQV69723.1 GHKL domain-containing protein [Denitrobaculum tricleocarpae]